GRCVGAVHMSPNGTKRRWSNVCSTSAFLGVKRTCCVERSYFDAPDPSATSSRNFCCDAQRRPSTTAVVMCGPKPEEGPPMKRREFIALLGGAAAAWPLAARAQPVSRIFRIGFVGLPTADSLPNRPEAFRAGLRDLGYHEGGNIVIEFRWADGHYERLPALFSELIRLNVDVIVTHGTPGGLAAKQATTTSGVGSRCKPGTAWRERDRIDLFRSSRAVSPFSASRAFDRKDSTQLS